ncbi:MAG: cupin domain-containing protein [Chloroflexi bacterium]|nr:cupin domain-containing protein [Chloroflexota bacterium]
MNLLTIAPGQKAGAHLHENHETALSILSGSTEFWYGDHLQHHALVQAGDFVYIPSGMPHLPWNPSQTEVCTVLIARTDPNEQESVVLLSELEQRLP